MENLLFIVQSQICTLFRKTFYLLSNAWRYWIGKEIYLILNSSKSEAW